MTSTNAAWRVRKGVSLKPACHRHSGLRSVAISLNTDADNKGLAKPSELSEATARGDHRHSGLRSVAISLNTDADNKGLAKPSELSEATARGDHRHSGLRSVAISL
eukprot:CAMPEP_0176217536 /NCGR_PEP_ID=MMETSP0121_2-20121125/17743_1 /TAXON_ID=160619 /ORGANISM="Kryptoperidinium foliaceum, Strain CCMP 1326" /LENGTH=105 /DNA_ID=CAMNT_0017556669 /DNA_START=297 /DNA_END=610 /DNA_ORIENTATION=-